MFKMKIIGVFDSFLMVRSTDNKNNIAIFDENIDIPQDFILNLSYKEYDFLPVISKKTKKHFLKIVKEL